MGQKAVPTSVNKNTIVSNNSKNSVKKSITNLRSSHPKVALVNTSILRQSKSRKSEAKKLSGSFVISRSSGLYNLKNGNKYDGMDYSTSLGYKIGPGSLSSGISYTQNLNDTDGESSTINDSNLKYSLEPRKIILGSTAVNVDWGASASAIIPFSKKSREVDQLQTALILATNLTLVASDELAVSGLGFSLGVSAGQNFHSFQTDKNGNYLNKNSSNQSISFFYSLNKIRFLVSYANKIRWAYQGEVRNSFEFSQDITWSFLDFWTAELGHTNSGSALKPNGMDSNLSVIDEDNSIVYLGLSYSF